MVKGNNAFNTNFFRYFMEYPSRKIYDRDVDMHFL